MDLTEAASRIQAFEQRALTDRLWDLENSFRGANKDGATELCTRNSLDSRLLISAFQLKQLAGQINVIIHAVGILAALHHILDKSEVVVELSLGAGNTGRNFDLETDRRIAEFKFINWKGGSESIRQNSLFKDFYQLAEAETEKARYLYVLGTEKPLKFLTGRRKLTSVMSKNASLAESFRKRFNDDFQVVREYYDYRKDRVKIVDLLPVLPELGGISD